jgi:hypothetical protein
VILDKDGNIFGGFTPVRWEFIDPKSRAVDPMDLSLGNFLFTLKNPHNLPPKKYPLKPEMKHKAVQCCDPPYYLVSGDYELQVSFDESCEGSVYIRNVYENDTGLEGNKVFTGSRDFDVEEIEVFEITEFDPAAESRSIRSSVPSLDSRIISDIPDIFAEFQGKQFSLLFRGSRDGFSYNHFWNFTGEMGTLPGIRM